MNEEDKKQRARESAKRYYQRNKAKVLKKQKEYAKRKYKEDETFRNKIKEKNKRYVINNPEKAREIKRKSQQKYMYKKRINGELPLTQKMLIEQLQQRIDKTIELLESWLHYKGIRTLGYYNQFRIEEMIETLKGESND